MNDEWSGAVLFEAKDFDKLRSICSTLFDPGESLDDDRRNALANRLYIILNDYGIKLSNEDLEK